MKKYILIILSLIFFKVLSLSQTCVAPSIQFNESEFEFGSIQEENGVVSHRFHFTNTGKSPLIISNVNVTCGCSASGWSKEPIAPGAKGYVDASFNPKGRPGKFTRTYTVVSNAENSQFPLQLKGEVISENLPLSTGAKIKFANNEFSFIEKEGKIVVYSFVFENTGTENLIIEELKSSCDCVSAKIIDKIVSPGKKGNIEVRFDTQKQPGMHNTNIEVISNANNGKQVLIFKGKVL